jgi:hypothetical protein
MSTKTRTVLFDAAAAHNWEVSETPRNLLFYKGDLGILVAFKAQGTRISYAEASEESGDTFITPRVFVNHKGNPTHIADTNVLAQVLAVLSA